MSCAQNENKKGNYNLIYSDTDSLLYDIRHPDIYDWISHNRENFDLSDSKRQDLKDDANKEVVGKLSKDDISSSIMTEFLAFIKRCTNLMRSTCKAINH